MALLDILLAILGISILVVIHEGGHYLVARASGMRVLRFSIGFGPPLVRYQPEGSPTVFQLCAIPFLAYVQIAGMNPQEEVDPDDPEIFPNKGLFARIATIAAGPFANYMAASIIIFCLAISGWPKVPVAPPTVREVTRESPAETAGLRPGDVIAEANGQEVRDFQHLIELTSPRPGEPTQYVIQRDGRRLPPITITPANRDGIGIIGVAPSVEPRYQSLGAAALAALVLPAEITVAQLVGIADLIRRRSTDGLIGPVGMGRVLAEQANRGLEDFVWMLVLLSIALGMFNLLPFPALDGGRLAFLGYELVTRRRPNDRFEAVVHTIGLLFLLGVVALVTVRDVLG